MPALPAAIAAAASGTSGAKLYFTPSAMPVATPARIVAASDPSRCSRRDAMSRTVLASPRAASGLKKCASRTCRYVTLNMSAATSPARALQTWRPSQYTRPTVSVPVSTLSDRAAR